MSFIRNGSSYGPKNWLPFCAFQLAVSPIGVNVVIERIELDGIDADVDASPVSDIDPGTFSFGISGPGNSPFKVGDLIPVRAFERGELPA